MNKLPVKGSKRCGRCQKELLYVNFTICRTYRYHGRNRLVISQHYSSYCKPCASENTRIRKLARKYGLSPEQFKEMFDGQGGRCLLCGISMRLGGKGRDRVCIDHDHQTGIVRGLLCFFCNAGLGMFEENVEAMARGILYIQGKL